MAKHTLTNNARGLRGINTATGLVNLNPGETREDLELDEAEVRDLKAAGEIAFGKAAAKAAAEGADSGGGEKK